jgi:hypothetical protein
VEDVVMGLSHKWNTGAHYTAHGQRIAAEVMDDGQVRFLDIDRGIGGVIAAPLAPLRDIHALREYVEFHYLRNLYKSSWDYSWADDVDWASIPRG